MKGQYMKRWTNTIRKLSPTRTPASENMYETASRGVQEIHKRKPAKLMGTDAEPPTYADVELQQQRDIKKRTQESFDLICASVRQLKICELDARDDVSNLFHRKLWVFWISTMMDMALVASSIYSCIGQDLKSLANVHDTDFLLRCIMKHRIEALLELQHRDPRLDDWLLLQMKVCDEWFDEMEALLSCLQDTREQLKIRWVESIWHQWEWFLRNGFDPVLADLWEPLVANIVLDGLDKYRVGQYPEEEEFSRHWFDTNIRFGLYGEWRFPLYQGQHIVGIYEGEIMVISINNRNYLKLLGGEGEMISRIPPEYRPKERWFEGIKTIVLVGYILRGMILSKFQERLGPSYLRNFGEALRRGIVESALDPAIVEALDSWAHQSNFIDRPGDIKLEFEVGLKVRARISTD